MIGDGTGWLDRRVPVERSLLLAAGFTMATVPLDGAWAGTCALAALLMLCWFAAGVLVGIIRDRGEP